MEELIRWVKTKVSNVVARAIVLAIREQGGQMFVQVEGLPDDIHSDVEHRQQYGFKSKPPVGVRGLLIAIGGDKSNLISILADSKELDNTLPYEDGESRQWEEAGAFLRMFDDMQFSEADSYEWKTTSDSKIEFSDGLFKITIDDDNKMEFVAGSLKFTVGGEVYTFTSSKFQTTTADVKAKTISLLNHLHGGSSSAPEGGVSNTQGPIP